MYIIAAALDDEAKDAVMETVEAIIGDGGNVVKTDRIGMRRLAYPIRKKNEGYYVLVEFEAPTELPKELDRRLRISDDVVRHMIINLDNDKEVA
jgi:small subunit ribosomal protein S6